MKYWILIITITSGLIFACNAESKDISKDTIIRQIIYKICNITMGTIRNAPPNKKEEMLKQFEYKLLKVAKVLNKTDLDENIRFIMQGVEEMTINNDFKLCAHGLPPINNRTMPPSNRTDDVATMKSANYSTVARRNFEGVSDKQTLVQTMIDKLEILAKKSFKNAVTAEDKKNILNKIRKRVDDALKRRNLDKDERNNSYSNLIMEGLELMMMKDNDSRRMSLELLANNPYAQQVDDIQTTTPGMGLTTEMACDHQLTGVCTALKHLNEVKCNYDDTVLGLDKICDGAIDCPDGSDEQYCAKQAVERVHGATNIMERIDMARKCFSRITNDALISRQNKMLSDLLQIEINFIKRYTTYRKLQGEKVKVNEYDERTVTQVTNEVSVLLKTFVMALTGAFCVNAKEEFDQIIHRLGESIEKEFEGVEYVSKQPVKQCICKEQFCMNSSCDSSCKRICYQKYSLTRWSCRAISGGSSVTLNYICDGKLDCYDETDENGCVINNRASKFDAGNIFDNLLKLVKTKTAAYASVPIRNKLVSLHDAIGTLQKRSMQPSIKHVVYKSLRDRCFALLAATYDLTLNIAEYANRAEDTYEFLTSVNQKLVTALKKSHTGNEKVIAPDGCFCRGFSCAMPKCSKKCTRTCAAKPYLTTYACTSPKYNDTFIPIDQICNGKPNCPEGEDEINCKKDFCRAHHLLILRHHLQKVGEKYKGTVLGEVIKPWKMKVKATLMIAEKKERPTHRDFKEIVTDILKDLTQTYSMLDNYRRTNNVPNMLKKFTKLAQHILETLKSCGM